MAGSVTMQFSEGSRNCGRHHHRGVLRLVLLACLAMAGGCQHDITQDLIGTWKGEPIATEIGGLTEGENAVPILWCEWNIQANGRAKLTLQLEGETEPRIQEVKWVISEQRDDACDVDFQIEGEGDDATRTVEITFIDPNSFLVIEKDADYRSPSIQFVRSQPNESSEEPSADN